MANSLADSPWSIDTAGGSLLVTGNVRLKRIRWVGATTVGHQAVIQDANNRIVWEEVAPGANFSTSEDGEFFFAGGCKVTTLGSGKLYLYVA